MTFNIETFKQQGLPFGGQRPSLFAILFAAPGGVAEVNQSAVNELSYQAKGTQIPASTMGVVEAGYFGRKIKLAGDRSFSDWTVNVYSDEDLASRSFFEAWSNGINEMEANVRESAAVGSGGDGASTTAPGQTGYKVDLTVYQYGQDGTVLRAYTLVGAWPRDVGAVQMDWDNQNQIITFGVTFAYDYWIPVEGAEQNARGGPVSLYAQAVDDAQQSSTSGI